MSGSEFDNIGELLETRVEQFPNKEFLFSESDGRVLTYASFDSAVKWASRLLISYGVRKGDKVSLFLTNSAEYLLFYFACFKIGAWAGPVNALLKPQEVAFVVGDSEAAVAVTQPSLYATLKEAAASLPSLLEIIVIEPGTEIASIPLGNFSSGRAFEEVGNGDFSMPEADADGDGRAPGNDDEAVIIYTSGTTGKPKGVLLTHGNLLANARQIAEWLRLTPKDRALMIMPLFHVNALMTTALAALWAGASVVLAPRFSASRHWDVVSEYGVTYFGSVATMLALLNHTYPDGIPERGRATTLRFALCGSAPVPVEVLNRFESLFHCPVIEGYGLSESTCRSTFNPIDDRRRPGSIGMSIGNEIRIFDEGDREVPVGQIGEIVLRGPNIMRCYYRNPEATENAFRSGWFHTGDMGRRDADGFFYIADRKSDMIIRAGENIYPREIDEVLYTHPSIKEAATIGVPDPLYGEEVKSFIVLRDGQQADESDILGFCHARLADFKCPKQLEFVNDIPKGPTGKLLKRELLKS